MTDTFLGDELPAAAPAAANERPCQSPGCESSIPEGSHPARKYCDEHFVGKHGKRKSEAAPGTVLNLNLPKPAAANAKDKRAKDTAAGATAFMNLAAAGAAMLAGGQADSPWMKDAGVVKAGAQGWGDAVGELSKYQPWISSIFAPVGGDNQAKAIFMVVVATAAIVVPVLGNHGALPGEVGAMMGGMFVAAEQQAAPDGSHQQPAA